MIPFKFFYPFYSIAPINIKRSMNCPKCADYERNSDNYAIEKLSQEISALANTKALQETKTQTENFIDYYMLHYRIEFTRLLNEKKQAAKESYNEVIDDKYTDDPDLCQICVKDTSIFDHPLTFCFHEGDYDPVCDGCVRKQKKIDNIVT